MVNEGLTEAGQCERWCSDHLYNSALSIELAGGTVFRTTQFWSQSMNTSRSLLISTSPILKSRLGQLVTSGILVCFIRNMCSLSSQHPRSMLWLYNARAASSVTKPENHVWPVSSESRPSVTTRGGLLGSWDNRMSRNSCLQRITIQSNPRSPKGEKCYPNPSQYDVVARLGACVGFWGLGWSRDWWMQA